MRHNVHIGAASRLCASIPSPSCSPMSFLSAYRPIPAQCKLPTFTTTAVFNTVRRSSSVPSQAMKTQKLDPTAANPPASTRPPALDLPSRESSSSVFSHLFHVGKAYLTFYKTGMKQIRENHRLRSSPDRPPPGTRANFLLEARHAHDLRRLPIFGLMLLICGEFTPLVVLAVPSVVPFTCRIPRQVDKLLRESEGRRSRALEDFGRKFPNEETPSIDVAAGHLARILDLVSPFWERVGITMPAAVVAGRVMKKLRFLAEDDVLLIKAGGVKALELDEVKLACADRAIRVRGRGENELRTALERWLQVVKQEGKEGSEGRMVELLLKGEDCWSM